MIAQLYSNHEKLLRVRIVRFVVSFVFVAIVELGRPTD